MNFRTVVIFICSCGLATARSIDFDNELAEEDGEYFEGDMILEEEQAMYLAMPNIRNGLDIEFFKWPKAEVYYRIGKEFDDAHVKEILMALESIEKATCIRFYPATSDMKGFINVTGMGKGCSSSVGYLGRQQVLNLQIHPIGKGCFVRGTIMHEFIHALGFYHQQSASDRDYYVRIVEENIQAGKVNNFRKYPSHLVSGFGVPYDYDSVMHYSALAFSKNGLPTIVPLDPQAKIGQRKQMSSKDILKINIMYKCMAKFGRVSNSVD